MEPTEDAGMRGWRAGEPRQGRTGWAQGAEEKWGGNSKSSVHVVRAAAEQARERGLQKPLVPTEGVCSSGKDNPSKWGRWQFHAGSGKISPEQGRAGCEQNLAGPVLC